MSIYIYIYIYPPVLTSEKNKNAAQSGSGFFFHFSEPKEINNAVPRFFFWFFFSKNRRVTWKNCKRSIATKSMVVRFFDPVVLNFFSTLTQVKGQETTSMIFELKWSQVSSSVHISKPQLTCRFFLLVWPQNKSKKELPPTLLHKIPLVAILKKKITILWSCKDWWFVFSPSKLQKCVFHGLFLHYFQLSPKEDKKVEPHNQINSFTLSTS